MDVITRLALMQPEVKIRVSVGGRLVLNIPAVPDLSERIALTLGQDFRGQLIPAAGESEGVRLQGFVSRPEFTRSGATQMYLYVNRRFVKDYLLNHAVMTAYRRLIEARRYPAVVLGLDVAAGGCRCERPSGEDGGPFSESAGDLCPHRGDAEQGDRRGPHRRQLQGRRYRQAQAGPGMPPVSKTP